MLPIYVFFFLISLIRDPEDPLCISARSRFCLGAAAAASVGDWSAGLALPD